MSMVSMWCKRLLTNLRLYESKLLHSRNAMVCTADASRGKVKIWIMKYPTALQAPDELAGLDEAPTDMNEQIGISERGKVRTWSVLQRNEALSRKISAI